MRHLLLFLAIAFLASCGEDTEGLTPEEYISVNSLQAEELDNGVFIVVHDKGNNVKPTVNDVIGASYVGKLTDDVVFDSNEDFVALLGDLIPGWLIGLQEIGVGGSCTLIIPHPMGFGNNINGIIPANSTLVFDIDLNNIFMSLTVDEYITENDLDTEELDKGVHIAVHDPGNEKRPTLSSDITVNYKGKLTNELVFDQGENVKFKLQNLIEGWQIGLLGLGEGGTCTLVLPSEVAYGSNGAGGIPPNTPLVFEIELLKIE